MEEITKTLRVEEILALNDAVEVLFQEHIKYPINVGFKLFQLKKHLNEISDYVINRMVELLPELKNEGCELSETNKMIYQVILNSLIEVNTYGITRDDIYCINETEYKNTPAVDLSIIEKLEPLF